MGQKRKSNEEFLEEVYEKYGNEYTVLDKYTLSKNRIHIKHKSCGTVFIRKAGDFLAGRQCPYCFGISKSPEKYEKEFNAKNKGRFKLLSKYRGVRKNVRVKCLICGMEMSRRSGEFVGNPAYDCPYCTGHINNPIEYNEKIKKVAGSEYTQLTPYTKAREKIKMRHNKCGYEYWITPRLFIKGSRCMMCYGHPRKTTKQFKQEVHTITKGEYECVSEYYNNKTYVEFYHTMCGKYYKARPHDFLSGNRCPFCKQSKGEKNIQNILDRLGIVYEIQKAFDDCGNNHQWLPFDFYIESLNLLIEYDGIQHYKEVEYFGGKDKLLDQQRRDEVKNNYCDNNLINLLRIPYFITDEQIQEKLPKYINRCKAESPKPRVRTMI